MKTGGTMNFLKRAGAILMVVAIFASSCNKYADDFKQLNTKLDALATTVAGVAGLQTDLTALKGQVTTLQGVVATLPTKAQQDGSFATLAAQLTATTAKIDAITASLVTISSAGTATKAVVDKLTTDLAALTAKVAADNATMIANGNSTVAKLVALDGKVDANQTALLAKMVELANSTAALSAKVTTDTAALTAKIAAAQQAAADGNTALGTKLSGEIAVAALAAANASTALGVQISAAALATSNASAALSAKIDAAALAAATASAALGVKIDAAALAIADSKSALSLQIATTTAAIEKAIADGNTALANQLASGNAAVLAAVAAGNTALANTLAANQAILVADISNSAASAAAASAAQLLQMANYQTALLGKFSDMAASDAANMVVLNNAIAALAASLAEMKTANATDLAAIIAKNDLVETNLTALLATLTASTANNFILTQGVVTTQAALLDAKIALVQTQLALAALQGNVGDATTAATINGLQAMLNAQKVSLDRLLANSNMFTGAVNITSDAEVAFYLPKIGVWTEGGMINGSFTVNTTAISAGKMADLQTIIGNIIAVIGGTGSATSITAKTGDNLVFTKLATVSGDYSVTGHDINDSQLISVGGNVNLDYDGGYTFPALSSVGTASVATGVISLFDYKTVATADSSGFTAVGTVAIDFSGLSTLNGTTPSFQTATSVVNKRGYGSTVNTVALNSSLFRSAASVLIGSAPVVVSVIANSASTVNINTLATTVFPANVTVSASKAGSSITLGGKTVTGILSIVGSTTSTVSLPNLVTVTGAAGIKGVTLSAPVLKTLTGAATLTNVTPVSLPALTTAPAGITAATATAFSAPLLVSAGVTVAAAIDVTLASSTTANLTAAVVENLTFTALDAVFATSNTSPVKTVNVTGKAATATGSFTYTAPAAAVNSLLATASFGGTLQAVSVSGFGTSGDKLTSLTTVAGSKITSFTLDNSDVITAVSLGHGHIVGGIGSTLVITNNAKLAGLVTSTDMLKNLTVTNNALLASANFGSYTNFVLGGGMTISIGGNKFGGAYTNSEAATFTTTYVQSKLTSATLTTLKPFLTAFAADQALPVIDRTSTATWTAFGIDLENVTLTGEAVPAVSPSNQLNDRMTADVTRTSPAVYTTPASGISTITDFLALVQ